MIIALIHGKFKSEVINFTYVQVNTHPPGQKRYISCDLKPQKVKQDDRIVLVCCEMNSGFFEIERCKTNPSEICIDLYASTNYTHPVSG